MPISHETPVPSDSRRDAERHHRILLALNRATDEIRRMEREGHPDIDEVLDRLLPDLATALNAEQAFVGVIREDEGRGEKWCELTTVYPSKDLRGHHLEWSDLLQRLIKDGKPKVIEPLWGETRGPIPGLEIFDATSAVLVRMQATDQVCVVGVCNKADPNLGPYLAADRMALDSIVELVAIGARIGERRRRELESIQRTSAAISAELELDELLPMIARGATEVFGAPATSLMLWDESRENLVIKASWGLSDEYVQQQCISRETVYTAISPSGKFLPFTVVDLRLEPFGQVEPIERERLCSALVVPLEVAAGEPIGALNIYSKDTPRQFTRDEKELARIFANQAVIAIQNARMYQLVTRRVEVMGSLERVGRTIVADLDLHQVLRLIVENATKVLGADISSVFLLDEGTNGQVPFGIANVRGTIKSLPREWRPQTEGLAVRVVKSKELLIVEDVESEKLAAKSKIVIAENVQSFVCCPLLAGEDVLGLLYVDFCTPHRFTLEELLTVQMFANQAAIAIKNASQYDALKQAQEELAAATIVAGLGIGGAEWSHQVHQKTSAIKYNVDTLRDQIAPKDEISLETLDDVENLAQMIEAIPLKGPLPAQTGEPVEPVAVDDELRNWLDRWCGRKPQVQLDLQLQSPDVFALIDRQWLMAVMEKLISNALKAMTEGGQLTVSSIVADDQVAVEIVDTGCGIPEDASPYFLRKPVPPEVRRDKTGSGMGALIARFILRSYGGDLELLWTEEGKGTALRVLLPLAQRTP